jgi:glycosyltransferase involved in cell wall biosynthesis
MLFNLGTAMLGGELSTVSARRRGASLSLTVALWPSVENQDMLRVAADEAGRGCGDRPRSLICAAGSSLLMGEDASAAVEDKIATPRKVMLISPSMGVGGAERQAFLLLGALDNTRWVGSLLTLDSGGVFYDSAVAQGHCATCLGIRSPFALRGLFRLRREIARVKPDVLLLRGFSATTLTRLAVLGMRGRPAVAVAEHSTGRPDSRTAFHDTVDAVLRPLADAFIGVAYGQLDYLLSEKHLPHERVHIIHNGIDYLPYLAGDWRAARRMLGIPEGAFVVGIVAALRPEKDHRTFLEAAASLKHVDDDIRFVIVGDGPLREQVERQVVELGLSHRVLMLGARTDVESILPALDVFTLSSSTVETLPMSVLEAMGSGLAVVATSVGGLRELVVEEETGLLVPPSLPESLANAWMRLHNNRTLMHEMGLRGRQRALELFSVEAMADGYQALFDHLASERRRQG